MTGIWCPAGFEVPNGATWRCNLLPGHVGPHDIGDGHTWGGDGPGRLQVAAYCLLGSVDGVQAIRDEFEAEFGQQQAEAALQALGRVLRRWKTEGQADA